MTIELSQVLSLGLAEILGGANAPAANADTGRLGYPSYDFSNEQLDGTTTPTVSEIIDCSGTIAAGPTPFDLDLTAAPRARDNTETIDLSTSSLRLVAMLISFATGNNVAGVTVAPGAADDYDIFGAGQSSLFFPGEILVIGIKAGGNADARRPQVAAADKMVRFSGAENDAWSGLMVFGS